MGGGWGGGVQLESGEIDNMMNSTRTLVQALSESLRGGHKYRRSLVDLRDLHSSTGASGPRMEMRHKIRRWEVVNHRGQR